MARTGSSMLNRDVSSLIFRVRISLVTSRGEGRRAVGRAVALAAAGAISGERLVTHRFPLDEIQAGFDMLRSRQGKPMKVVFIP